MIFNHLRIRCHSFRYFFWIMSEKDIFLSDILLLSQIITKTNNFPFHHIIILVIYLLLCLYKGFTFYSFVFGLISSSSLLSIRSVKVSVISITQILRGINSGNSRSAKSAFIHITIITFWLWILIFMYFWIFWSLKFTNYLNSEPQKWQKR